MVQPENVRTDALVLRAVESEEAFAELRTAWNELAARRARASVFLRHEWFDAAWQWRQQSSQLFILCLYAGARLVAVMPLVRGRPRSAAARQLEFLTVPDTQACDIIVADSERSTAAAGFADALVARRHAWNKLRLAYLPDGSVVAGEFASALAGHHVRHTVTQGDRNPYIALDGGWDAFYATRSRSLKKANNLCANRLAKLGTVSVECVASGIMERSAIDAVVDTVTAVSARSWKSRTGNSLDQRGPQAFIRRLSHLAGEGGWLSVWLLRLDGKPLAMEYQLVAGAKAHALRSDFDAGYEEVSPGSHLNRVMLEQLCARGVAQYCMGPGGNAYKLRWTDLADPVGELAAYSPTTRGAFAAKWQLDLKPRLRRLRDRWATTRNDDSVPVPRA